MRTVLYIRLTILILLISLNAKAQDNDSNITASKKVYAAHLEEVEIRDANFERHFRFMKRKVIKMYPYAQYCKELLYEFNKELLSTSSKRKRRKISRSTHKELKENFKYVVINMTETEGRVLTKLIYKETAMSVYDIIETYRGTTRAKYWNFFSKAFDQDLQATYDDEDDWIIEMIYNRIKVGMYSVEEEADIITKEEYKDKKEARKERIKKNKEKRKKAKRKKRKQERKKKREKRRSSKSN